MLLKTIDRYILTELTKIFVISTGTLTMVLYLDKFLFMAKMIVNRGVTLIEMGWIMAYLSPAFLALTIPMSVLVAALVAFNQFSVNNEWIAMKASHWSFLHLMKPVLFFSILVYLLENLIMFYALPWGNLSYKKIIYELIQTRADLDIKPKVFNKDFKNLILLVEDREGESRLTGVYIADHTKSENPKIITAENGIIFPDSEALKIQLKLQKGTIHELSETRSDYQTINFDRYDLTLDLPDTERLQEKALVGNREMSVSQVRERIKEMEKQGLPTHGPKVEISKKFSIPFTCLLFGLLGAPMGIHSSRSGKSGSFALAVAIILVYYIGLILTQNLGRIGKIEPYTSVWIPNIILLVAVIYIAYKMQKELPFKFSDWIFGTAVLIFQNVWGFLLKLKSEKPQPKSKNHEFHPNQKKLDREKQFILDRKLKKREQKKNIVRERSDT